MEIRQAIQKDWEQIEQLAKEQGISLPKDGTYIVAVNDNGNIRAFANMRGVIMIEPFISASPQASQKLWNHIAGVASEKGIKILRCFAKEKDVKLFTKLGFYKVFKKMIPMEINFFK